MKIGAWGDSITYGTCDSEALGWVGRLRKSFPDDDDARVYNRGVGGDTTEDILKRFAVEADSIKPTTIIFAIGINDSKYPVGGETNEVPLEAFKKNIRTLVEEARVHTKKIFLVGATKVDEEALAKWDSRFLNSEITKYNDALKELSAEQNLPYIDVFETLDEKGDLYEGLHPNAQGYEKLAAVIGKALKQ